VRYFIVSGLAKRRKAGLEAIAHLRFIQDNFVDQQVVKQGLLHGLSQGELAKALGMSKRDVNRLARFPYTPAGRLKNDRYGAIRDAFLATVWGSEARRTRRSSGARSTTLSTSRCNPPPHNAFRPPYSSL
jgi:hypothetical protein